GVAALRAVSTHGVDLRGFSVAGHSRAVSTHGVDLRGFSVAGHLARGIHAWRGSTGFYLAVIRVDPRHAWMHSVPVLRGHRWGGVTGAG
ncbi:hypothetical protein ACTUVK_000903, partial [Stenotrophomonas rhizophila]